jgi:hypothetical protein
VGTHPVFRLDGAARDGYDKAMLRKARVVIAGVAQDVTERERNQQDVFFVDADRAVFLQSLGGSLQAERNPRWIFSGRN